MALSSTLLLAVFGSGFWWNTDIFDIHYTSNYLLNLQFLYFAWYLQRIDLFHMSQVYKHVLQSKIMA